jgi:hypothetical protein
MTTARHLQDGLITRRLAVAGVLTMLCLGSSSAATAASRSATASVTVVRVITVSRAATMAFGRAVPTGASPFGYVILPAPPPSARAAQAATLLPGATSSPLILNVTGEPGRAYRINVPASASSSPSRFSVNTFSIWTQTSGDVTTSKSSRFDASGRDTIRIGGRLAIPKSTPAAQSYTADVPVTIGYE